MKIRLILFALIVVIVCSCDNSTDPGDDLRSELLAEPVHNLDNYDFDPSAPLADRIYASGDFVLQYARDFDNDQSYEFYEPTEEQLGMVAEYLDMLPEDYLSVMRERLIGIYFIKGYQASGMTDFVLDPAGDDIYCIMFLNPETMEHNMQEWVTHKENTCFIDDDPATEIRIRLSDEYTGLLYILAHECTHVVDYSTHVTPYTEPAIGKLLGRMDAESAFTDDVWTDYRTPAADCDYQMREDISFYGFGGGPLLSDTAAVGIYSGLAGSPFVSLYGSLSWAEDLAEYMCFNHLVNHLGIEYKIEVIRNDSLIFEYEPFSRQQVAGRIDHVPDYY